MSVVRWLCATPLALAIACGAGSASAQSTPAPSKAACIEAYKSAQESSRSGHLSRAREQALVCARDPCPAVLQKDCKEWVADVEQRVPTVMVVVKDGEGKDVTDARMIIDGVVVPKRVDGRSMEIDPGEHKIEIFAEGRPKLVQTIVAREREKGREITFAYEPPKKKEPPTPTVIGPPTPGPRDSTEKPPLRWTFWTAAGLGGAGLLGFGIFGASGLVVRSDLDACKPNCSQQRIDHGKTSFLVADVSLGIGLVAAGVATYLYFTRPQTP